jgi:hypothetical protein
LTFNKAMSDAFAPATFSNGRISMLKLPDQYAIRNRSRISHDIVAASLKA